MKKLLILTLCLSLLTGCASRSAYSPQRTEPAATAAAAAPTALTAAAEPVATPLPVPGVTREPVPAATSATKPTAAPTATPTPRPTATPSPTAVPDQTCTGTYFAFEAPGSWLRADVTDGVYFYPDPADTRHTSLCYQEMPNDMGLTETKMDVALMFSSKETVTAMVEGALTNSGMTNFKLSPVNIQKTKLNGLTCYKGASDITQAGETYDFVGHIFLRGDKMVLFIWVGDQVKYASALKQVYDSVQAVT